MSGATVLLVENNEDNQNIYRTLLRHEGFETVEAVNGAQGVRLARALRPDIIVMDISMPVLDGWKATLLLKQDAHTAAIPIIILTVHSAPEDRQRAEEVGCDSYLATPIEPQRVVEEIRRLLGPGI